MSNLHFTNFVPILRADVLGFLSPNCIARVGCVSHSGKTAAAVAVREQAVQISVIMPVFNALAVGLPLAMCDIISQSGCSPYEVVITDDGSTDGSREWLIALTKALGVRGFADGIENSVELYARSYGTNGIYAGSDGGGRCCTDGSIFGADCRSKDDEHHLGGRSGPGTGFHASKRGDTSVADAGASQLIGNVDPKKLSPSTVAAYASSPFVRLVLYSTREGARGQGAAMDCSLHGARGNLIALMESDDIRPQNALAKLCARHCGVTEENTNQSIMRNLGGSVMSPEGVQKGAEPPQKKKRYSSINNTVLLPDAVCSTVHLVTEHNKRFQGMHRYITWQNSLVTSKQMARARFIEIPALHQTSIYRRCDCNILGGFDVNPQWPVDMDFWMRWFAAGKTCEKICDRGSLRLSESTSSHAPKLSSVSSLLESYPSLYGWRQHSGQGTRNSGRCSLDNLRLCKIHYLAVDPAGPCHKRRVMVVSTGSTLESYVKGLKSCGACLGVVGVAWDTKTWEGYNGCPPDNVISPWIGSANAIERDIRLFVYGSPKARRRGRIMLEKQGTWDDDRDWFAA